MSALHLAFYRGRRAENASARLFDWLIAWYTRGPFSHIELVFDYRPGDASECASSSIRDGGVRHKFIVLDPSRWVVVRVPGSTDSDRALAQARFATAAGAPYDWLGILGFVLHRRLHSRRAWFCSEIVAHALGWPQKRPSPNDMARRLGLAS